MSNGVSYCLCSLIVAAVVAAEVLYGQGVVALVRTKPSGRWPKILAVAVLVSDVVRMLGCFVWGYQERAPYWFSHSSSWRTGVVSGLLFGPLFFPLMYLLATCVLPFSPFFPFALMAAPAAAASVVRARTIWRTSKRSWPKTIFVFIVTYWPEALILPLLDR